MKTKSFVAAVLALVLSLRAFSAMAEPPPVDLLGDPEPATAADRTITITPNTKYVNVEAGQVVKFTTGSQSFTWNFDGAESVEAFDLNRITPPGMLDHKVTAYVAPNPVHTN